MWDGARTVRDWLFENDLRQAKLARRAHISEDHLSQCLNNHRPPGPNTLRKLERAMGLEPGSLTAVEAKEPVDA